MTYEIKPVRPEDCPWVINVAAKNMIYDELKRPELYSKEALDPLVDKVVDDGTGLICWLGDERVGMLGGILTNHFLNPAISILVEVVWYVESHYRSTRAPYLLLKGYKELIRQKADEGVLTILKDSPIKDESLEKLEFMLQEKNYIYRK